MKLLYWLHRLLQRLSGGRAGIVPYLFYAQPVPEQPPARRASGGARGERVTTRACLPDVLPRPEAVIAERLASGSRCLFLAKDSELVGFLWLHRGPYREDEVRAVFAPKPAASAAWDFDVYVAPAYRLSRAFGRLWDAANEELRSEGVRWCHSRISAFNLSSIAVHEKLGARQVGWAGFLCLGGFQLMVSSLKPWVHVSLRGEPSLSPPSPEA